jgi:hypothetical protein
MWRISRDRSMFYDIPMEAVLAGIVSPHILSVEGNQEYKFSCSTLDIF